MIPLLRLRALHEQFRKGSRPIKPEEFAEYQQLLVQSAPDLLHAAETLETLRGMRERIEREAQIWPNHNGGGCGPLLRDLLAVIAAEPSPPSPKETT